jgi:hypothetical protein
MKWSDLARQNAENLAQAEQQRALSDEKARKSAASKVQLDAEIEKRVEQFLEVMDAAGNPGVSYLTIRDRIRGVGYWGVGAFQHGRQSGKVGLIVRTDGSWDYTLSKHPEEDAESSILSQGPLSYVMTTLASILRRHKLPLPRD